MVQSVIGSYPKFSPRVFINNHYIIAGQPVFCCEAGEGAIFRIKED